MNDEDHCTTKWYEIECDLKGRVQSITMSKNYVEGVIPKEFMSLGELMTLDLSNNNMVGSVMKESISMSKMYTVQLNNNKLGGEFPFGEVKDGATNLGKFVIILCVCVETKMRSLISNIMVLTTNMIF